MAEKREKNKILFLTLGGKNPMVIETHSFIKEYIENLNKHSSETWSNQIYNPITISFEHQYANTIKTAIFLIFKNKKNIRKNYVNIEYSKTEYIQRYDTFEWNIASLIENKSLIMNAYVTSTGELTKKISKFHPLSELFYYYLNKGNVPNYIDQLTFMINNAEKSLIGIGEDSLYYKESEEIEYIPSLAEMNKTIIENLSYIPNLNDGLKDGISIGMIRNKIIEILNSGEADELKPELIDNIMKKYFIYTTNGDIYYTYMDDDKSALMIITLPELLKSIGNDFVVAIGKKGKHITFKDRYIKWPFICYSGVKCVPYTSWQPSISKNDDYYNVFTPLSFEPKLISEVPKILLNRLYISKNYDEFNELVSDDEFNVLRQFYNERGDNFFVNPDISKKELYDNFHEILSHVMKIICQGEIDRFIYIFNWILNILLYPRTKTQRILILPGPEGSGKSSFANAILELIEPYSIGGSYLKNCLSKFNYIFWGKLLACFEEGESLNSKSCANLKNLCTAKEEVYEQKNKVSFKDVNNLNIIILQNGPFTIKVDDYTRRFAFYPVEHDWNHLNDMDLVTKFDKLHIGLESGVFKLVIEWFLNSSYFFDKFNFKQLPESLKESLSNECLLSNINQLDLKIIDCINSISTLSFNPLGTNASNKKNKNLICLPGKTIEQTNIIKAQKNNDKKHESSEWYTELPMKHFPAFKNKHLDGQHGRIIRHFQKFFSNLKGNENQLVKVSTSAYSISGAILNIPEWHCFYIQNWVKRPSYYHLKLSEVYSPFGEYGFDPNVMCTFIDFFELMSCYSNMGKLFAMFSTFFYQCYPLNDDFEDKLKVNKFLVFKKIFKQKEITLETLEYDGIHLILTTKQDIKYEIYFTEDVRRLSENIHHYQEIRKHIIILNDIYIDTQLENIEKLHGYMKDCYDYFEILIGNINISIDETNKTLYFTNRILNKENILREVLFFETPEIIEEREDVNTTPKKKRKVNK